MSMRVGSAVDEQPAERLDVSEARGGEPPRVQRSLRPISTASSTGTGTSTATPSTASSATLDDGTQAARPQNLLRRPQ